MSSSRRLPLACRFLTLSTVMGLRLQVDAVGQASDEQFDSLDAGDLGKAVLRLEHGSLQVEGISSIRQRWAMWWTCNPLSGDSVTRRIELDLAAEHPVDRRGVRQHER